MPRPPGRPAKTGHIRLSVRLRPELHRLLSEEADRAGRSMADVIEALIADALPRNHGRTEEA